MKLTLRKADRSDLDFARRITKENLGEFIDRHLGGWDSRKFDGGFRPGEDEMIVVGIECVGFLSAAVREEVLYIGNLQIRSEFQRKGIGREVMRRLEARAMEGGLRRVEFNVFSVNPAMEFYRKLGYSVGSVSGPLLRMRKELQPVPSSSERIHRPTNRESQ